MPLPSTHTISRSNSGSAQAEIAGQLAARQLHKEQLGEQITELAAHIHAATFRLLELIREFDSCEGWAGEGVLSCAHWLNWKCGMALGVARERVRVAHALKDLPKISQTFRRGKISYSKVRAITRVATRKNENYLLMIAHYGTANHVERLVRNYRSCKRAEAFETAKFQEQHQELKWYFDDDGYWVLRGRFCPEQGALLQAALQQAMEEEYQERKNIPAGTPTDISDEIQDEISTRPEPVASRRAAALLRMAQGYPSKPLCQGSSEPKSEPKSEHWLVHIHTDMETLKPNGTGAEAEIESGGKLGFETTRRIACDSSVVGWLERHDGQALSVGRKTRTIPPAIRRALHRRDGGCRFPGCTATRFVDAHHIHHWADGGETSMSNLLLLCRHHHRLVHEGGFGLQKLSNSEFKFTNPAGISIPNCPAGRSRGNVDTLFALNDKHAIRITSKSSHSHWTGEIMDDQLAVEGLLFRE